MGLDRWKDDDVSVVLIEINSRAEMTQRKLQKPLEANEAFSWDSMNNLQCKDWTCWRADAT